MAKKIAPRTVIRRALKGHPVRLPFHDEHDYIPAEGRAQPVARLLPGGWQSGSAINLSESGFTGLKDFQDRNPNRDIPMGHDRGCRGVLACGVHPWAPAPSLGPRFRGGDGGGRAATGDGQERWWLCPEGQGLGGLICQFAAEGENALTLTLSRREREQLIGPGRRWVRGYCRSSPRPAHPWVPAFAGETVEGGGDGGGAGVTVSAGGRWVRRDGRSYPRPDPSLGSRFRGNDGGGAGGDGGWAF